MRNENCKECLSLTAGACSKHNCCGILNNGESYGHSGSCKAEIKIPDCKNNPQGNGVHQWKWNNNTSEFKWNCIFCGIGAY